MTNRHSFTCNEHVCAVVNRKQRVGGFIYRKCFGGRKAMAERKKEDMALCVIVSKCLSFMPSRLKPNHGIFKPKQGMQCFQMFPL